MKAKDQEDFKDSRDNACRSLMSRTEPGRKQVSEEYLTKVKEILERLNETGE